MMVVGKQSANMSVIVQSSGTILLLGGSHIWQAGLNKCLSYTDQCVAVDGGADVAMAQGLTPRAVIGDFDSLSDAARHTFASILHPAPDQNQTDFEKALCRVDAEMILALGFLGGRLDHTMATLNVLVRHINRPVVALSETEVVFAHVGAGVLHIAPGAPVSVLPMAATRMSTKGLRWDLDNSVLAPDGLVSSSNAAEHAEVQLHSDQPVIITLPVTALDAAIAAVRAR